MLASVAAALALSTIFVATESQRGGGSPTTLNIEVAVVMFVLYVLYLIFYFRSPEGASPPARGTRHSARWPRSCCSPRRPRQSPTSRRPLSAPSSR
jgi:Ca2+/Na+ antiporter